MVGGGSRRDEGSISLNNSNVFAALGSLRRKKKTDKESKNKRSIGGAAQKQEVEPVKQLFWAPAPIVSKSWADIEDEDDDDYYATTAPPQSIWGPPIPPKVEEESSNHVEEEESESGIDEMEDDEGEEQEHDVESETELKVDVEDKAGLKAVCQKIPELPLAPKDPERQLSKKELRKKGLEELEAVLAELGYPTKDATNQTEVRDKKEEYGDPDGDPNEAVSKKAVAGGEAKYLKKKKKKEKAVPKEEAVAAEEEDDDHTPPPLLVDIKEKLKKMGAAKKKKSDSSAARAAAGEAALRTARVAAAKKKEKNHYNQQPIR